MFKVPGKIVRDNKSSSYPVFELTGVNCINNSIEIHQLVFYKPRLIQLTSVKKNQGERP